MNLSSTSAPISASTPTSISTSAPASVLAATPRDVADTGRIRLGGSFRLPSSRG